MILIYLIAIPVTYYLCKWWVKLVFWVFGNPLARQGYGNRYIQAHKAKLENDRKYEEYEDWLAKEGSGVPIPKVMTPEDVAAEREIKRLI